MNIKGKIAESITLMGTCFSSNLINKDRAPEFFSLRNKLKDIIFYADKPRPVRFISDNASILIITGLGKFEPFDDKIFNLKPGKYEIRARKKGYCSYFLS